MAVSTSPQTLAEQIPLLVVGYEAACGLPFPFESKIVDALTKLDNTDDLRSLLKSWILIHGVFYQYSSQLQENRVSMRSMIRLQQKIIKTYNAPSLANEIKLIIIRNSKHNPIFEQLAKFKLFRIPQSISFIKSLKRKYALCNTRYSASHISKVLCWATSLFIKLICAAEFANCGWMKAAKYKRAANICRSIRFYNFISQRVATEIVLVRETATRAQYIERCIEIAYHAHQMKNFEVVSAMISGLNSCAVSPCRLKKSWSLVSKKYISIFDELESLAAPISNYITYRKTISELQKNKELFVPTLSVILRDIVAADVSSSGINPSEIPSEQLMVIGKIVWPISQLQMSPVVHQEMEEDYQNYSTFLLKLLANAPGCENLLMRLSYKREPPKNLQLLCDDDQFSPVSGSDFSASYDEISVGLVSENDEMQTPSDAGSSSDDPQMPLQRPEQIGNLAKFWSNALSKDPATWNQLEVQVIMESWGLPPDLCEKLSRRYVKNGAALLKFIPSEALVPQAQYRVLINSKLEELIQARVADGDQQRETNPLVSGWSTGDVCSWLHESSLGKYAALFEENSITGRNLLSISAADLQEMGIEKVSARKKILKEIKKVANVNNRINRRSRSNLSKTR